ncbi:MAG TPA: tRNA dihydrouridine synthase DusB [Nitrospirota bacterium]
MIGNLQINGIGVLAPLAGITDLPFRLICKELGAALVYTEMISSEGLIRGQRATVDITESVQQERPVAFQIFGSKPDSMAESAMLLADRGADIIDINMGCPVKKVLKSGSGAALLQDLKQAEEILSAVVKASPVPVTVKIRTGWAATDFVAVDYAKMAEAAGAAAVAVHGRYARQMFAGQADWSAIARVKQAVSIPVMGNGDVWTAMDAKRMMDETGCDLVMIGRGALGNPWIFGEVNGLLKNGELPAKPSPEERGRMLVRHLEHVVSRGRELAGVKLMRKHAAWYSRGLRGAAEFRKEINHTEELSVFRDAVTGFFSGPQEAVLQGQPVPLFP